MGTIPTANPQPNAVVRADFNGDGFEDLATLNYPNAGVSSVTVLLGFGDGTFGTPQSYDVEVAPATAGPEVMVAGDFDADGHPDLAVVDVGGRIEIFRGSASGALTPESPFSLMGAPAAVGLVTADFNGDGKPDLAVYENTTGQIAILTNTSSPGTFAFTEADQSLLSGTPTSLAAADVDGDMRVDIIAALGNPKELVVLLNKPAGFSPEAPVSLPSTPAMLVATDLNGDKKVDALVACTDGSLQLLLGNGAGGFGASASIGDAGNTIGQLGIGDVTGDGLPDVVALTSSRLALLPSTGMGTWGSAQFFLPGGATGMAVGDLNGDGHADVAVGTAAADDVAVLLAAPYTLLTGPLDNSTQKTFGQAVLADINGDGHLDAVAVSAATDEVGVFLNDGHGNLAPVVTYGVGTGAQPSTVAVGDLNGDGRLDLAVSSPGLSSISIMLATPTGFAPVKQVTIGGNGLVGVVVADFNNDSKLDLLAYGSSGLSFVAGTGTGSFGAPTTQANQAYTQIATLVATKVNKDQTLDLVGVGTANYPTVAFTLLGNGDGTFGGGKSINLNGYYDSRGSLAVGDYDNDGNVDAVFSGTLNTNFFLTPVIQFFAGDGTGNLTSKGSIGQVTAAGIAAGDFDGDGKLDFAAARVDAQAPGIEVFLGNGAWQFTEGFFRASSLSPQSLAAGDLVGDGRPSLFFGVQAGASELLNVCK